MKTPECRIECDVLVVGGASAALVAALEARKQVENVVLACKGRPGHSGNTIVSGAAFSVYVPSPDNPDSADRHLLDTLKGGFGVNDPQLARTLTLNGERAVLGLEEYGVRLQRSEGALVRRTPPGHSAPRSIPTDLTGYVHALRGLSITVPLAETARARGIKLLSNTTVVRLLVVDGAVCGAIAVDGSTGDPVRIDARAVVLAAGGGGHLFAQTNNTRDVTGDSFALALEAGAALRDMEFIQFYPTRAIAPVHTNVSSPLFGEGAVLRNRHGERFMERYDPKADMATRDVMSRAIFSEVQAGNGVGGGVYIDLSAVPLKTMELKYPTTLSLLRAHGIDPAHPTLVVSPTVHFVMGGVWIDSGCRTSVAGLYAAGEAAGGVHGANRLAGNALTETVVFGSIAGREASSYARKSRGVPIPPAIGSNGVPIQPGSVSPAEVRSRVRQILWDRAGLVRSEDGLNAAQRELCDCEDALRRCRVQTPLDQAACGELSRMIRVGNVIVAAALSRRESRGAHYRSDFPDRNDGRWLGSSRATPAEGSFKIEFVPTSAHQG